MVDALGYIRQIKSVPVVGPYLLDVAGRVQNEAQSDPCQKNAWMAVAGLTATYLFSARREGTWAKAVLGVQVLAVTGQFFVADQIDHFLHPMETKKASGGWLSGLFNRKSPEEEKSPLQKRFANLGKFDPKMMMVGHMIVALICQKGVFNGKVFFMLLGATATGFLNIDYLKGRKIDQFILEMVAGAATGLIGLPLS